MKFSVRGAISLSFDLLFGSDLSFEDPFLAFFDSLKKKKNLELEREKRRKQSTRRTPGRFSQRWS